MRHDQTGALPDRSTQRASDVVWHGITAGEGPERDALPAIWECVQQFGRHDNKEVHVVMT
jgi:hypothetical protein